MVELSKVVTRRGVMAGAAAAVGVAKAQTLLGPPPHKKGPLVFLDYDQIELDAAYNQRAYEPNLPQIMAKLTSNSAAARTRIGDPIRVAYGTNEIEKLDIFQAKGIAAPVLVFIHGGAWREGLSSDYSYLAEMLVHAGAHCVIPDFSWVPNVSGRLEPLARQVCSAIAWVYRNAASLQGDRAHFYVAGHSSGGHLAAVALTADWKKEFGLDPGFIRGGLCVSGMYDLKPVRLSSRNSYVKIDDQTESELSPLRHIDRLHSPLVVAYGTFETPEFQRQSRAFAAAVKDAGKSAVLIAAENYAHMEMAESLGNPYSPVGRALLKQMGIG